MTELTASALARVDDVPVLSRQPAVVSLPVANGAPPTSIKGVDHLLLSNGSETYQCVGERGCGKTFPTANQVVTHRAMHSPRAEARRAAKMAAAVSAATVATEPRRRRGRPTKDESITMRLQQLGEHLSEATRLLNELGRLVTVSSDEFTELRRKADAYDALKKLMR